MMATGTTVAPVGTAKTHALIAQAAASDKFEIGDILDQMRKGILDREAATAQADPQGKFEVATAKDEPALPALTDQFKADLVAIVEGWDAVDINVKRPLTEGEREIVAIRGQLVHTTAEALKKLYENYYRELAANDLDHAAIDQDLVDEDTTVDDRGHFVVKVATKAVKAGLRLVREVRSTTKVRPDEDKLPLVLTDKEWKAISRPVRRREYEPALLKAYAVTHPAIMDKIAAEATLPAKASGAISIKK